MATSVVTVPKESPYYGQALGRQYIRLITNIWAEEPLEIQIRRYGLTDDLEFDAVSYVWGTAPASVPATCNGKALFVTPTAHEMLKHLHRYTPLPRRPLWIDAICINQEDPEEKATQIPLMSRIFSRAARVVVWMGPSTPETEAFVVEFPRLSEVAKNWVATGVDHYAPGVRETQNWPNRHDAFWDGFYHLLRGEWFTRLWTFQEAVIAKQAIMLCGAYSVDLNDFIEFSCNGAYGSMPYIPAQKGKTPNSQRIRGFYAWRECENIWACRKLYSQGPMGVITILNLLQNLRSRQVKMSVDRIWALVGLFEEEFQKELAPLVDYSTTACNEYWRTFVSFSKSLLRKKQSLGLLTIPPSTENMNDRLPSWCPNLSGRISCPYRIRDFWNEPTDDPGQTLSLLLFNEKKEKSHTRRHSILNHSRTHVWTLKDDNLLRVRGFCVDTILEVIEDPRLLGADDYIYDQGWASVSNSNPTHVAVMDWESRSLGLARRVFYGTDKGVSNIPPEYLMALCLDCRINDQAETAYVDLMGVYKSRNPARCFYDLEFSRRNRVSQFDARFRSLTGHSFFSTKCGRIGLATPGCNPGDRLCVFYGGQPLHILRWSACDDIAGSEHGGAPAEFKGVAFVPHLMELHQWEDARLGSDETFVIR